MRPFLFLLALVASPTWSENGSANAPQTPAPEKAATTRSAAAGGSAVPVEDPAAARDLFRQLDRNGEGYLTADELWSLRGQDTNWAAIDRNRDGRISPEEFKAFRPR